MKINRRIVKIMEPRYVMEGAGVRLLRSISPHSSNPFDPFLLFDHFAFNNPAEGENPGFPMHPHRGIETVTYMLDGYVRHRDSLGNAGLIGPGDVQWMNSGGGILHEEMPRAGADGNIYGFQLWINLPAAQKMSSPQYQGFNASNFPVSNENGAAIRVIAGHFRGAQGPVQDTAVKPMYLEVTLQPGAEFIQELPAEHTALAYVFEGSGVFNQLDEVAAIKMVQLVEGDCIQVRASGNAPMRFVLFSGAPLKEPIVPYGPFVMNTIEEIQQALLDLREGTFVK